MIDVILNFFGIDYILTDSVIENCIPVLISVSFVFVFYVFVCFFQFIIKLLGKK